jgi:hypothetical protein
MTNVHITLSYSISINIIFLNIEKRFSNFLHKNVFMEKKIGKISAFLKII